MMQQQLIGLWGLYKKESLRFFRIWPQALVAPAITIILYFLIFGRFIGHHIRHIAGVPYITYIAPGLIMLPIVMNSYANIVSSIYIARNNKSLEEILISPMSPLMIVLGYVGGAMSRGIVLGFIITIVALLMSGTGIQHPFLFLLFAILTAALFSLAGMLNGIFAKKFDDTAIFTTFILTPLIYLSGIFYSISSLSPTWRFISKFNPIHYVTELFHYAYFGGGASVVAKSLIVIVLLIVILFYLNWHQVKKGGGIKT